MPAKFRFRNYRNFQLVFVETSWDVSNVEGFERWPGQLMKTEGFLSAPNPIPSMYGIFTYIWLIFMVNVGIYHTWILWE